MFIDSDKTTATPSITKGELCTTWQYPTFQFFDRDCVCACKDIEAVTQEAGTVWLPIPTIPSDLEPFLQGFMPLASSQFCELLPRP